MMRVMRCKSSNERIRAFRPAVVVSLALAILGGGCSADVARFDFPGMGLTDQDGTGSAVPRPTLPMRSGGSSLIDSSASSPSSDVRSSGGYTPPSNSRDSGVKVAALPDPVTPAPATVEPRKSSLSPAAVTAQPASVPVAGGETIEIQAGDTLFGLSKRHKVSVAELMSVNGLKSPNLKPGQKLVLPAGRAPMKPGTKNRPAGDPAAAPGAVVGAARPAPAAQPAAKAANWDGSYTVKPGDSIYAIARRYKVAQTELQQANGIQDPLKVRPGTVLKVPDSGGGVASASAAASPDATAARETTQARAEPKTEPAAAAPRVIQSTTQPTIINSEKKVAARTDTATDASAVEAEKPAAESAAQPSKGEKTAAAGGGLASGGKLRWPVKGKIVTAFGPRTDGTHNDGVNVAVPLGTEVHAAEAGTVAYAGSELKGYGNLILLRHDNGWVTAYAHNEELLVKRGDRVKRGQTVAKAGKSGQVDQPQVHFELRQGSKPVDPTPFMEKM